MKIQDRKLPRIGTIMKCKPGSEEYFAVKMSGLIALQPEAKEYICVDSDNWLDMCWFKPYDKTQLPQPNNAQIRCGCDAQYLDELFETITEPYSASEEKN